MTPTDLSTPPTTSVSASFHLAPDTPVKAIPAGDGRTQVIVFTPNGGIFTIAGDDADIERWFSEANVALSAHLLAKANRETIEAVAS